MKLKRNHIKKLRMTVPTLFTIFVLCSPGASSAGPSPDVGEKPVVNYFRGNALDLETGKFLYSENHAEYLIGGEHAYSIVTYRDPNGKVFARKRISFVKNPTQPDFQLEDFRDGYIEGAKLLGGSRFQFFKRSRAGEEIQKEVVKIDSPGIIDGGFDYYVRENFETLAAGAPQTVNFGVSARFTYFSFVIARAGETTKNGRPAVRFKISPQNILLRQFVEPLYVTYDRESRRLLEYTGYTNIDDGTDSGRNYAARIVFTYTR